MGIKCSSQTLARNLEKIGFRVESAVSISDSLLAHLRPLFHLNCHSLSPTATRFSILAPFQPLHCPWWTLFPSGKKFSCLCILTSFVMAATSTPSGAKADDMGLRPTSFLVLDFEQLVALSPQPDIVLESRSRLASSTTWFSWDILRGHLSSAFLHRHRPHSSSRFHILNLHYRPLSRGREG
ncbi:hypothetical protein MIND_01289900 [Mycena indigotica]|uniref:Uncharacterized protein n=1 Tax=Mycena indigotica TaxID=2126181 RepID=A0A8H6S422_9AGAR|nr:uncharacterized protein MIND_01289900 [Mycena indigotica]KAF7291447.1 hypothetical protein MIND_01289900 [Mycena indigotica]